jgi:hypothetical protein
MENFKAIDAFMAIEKYDLMQLILSSEGLAAKHVTTCRPALAIDMYPSIF